jgi:ACS family glucarate transporter-like MFS transporter
MHARYEPFGQFRSTNVRWGVLGFSVVMAVLLYLDRFAMSVAQPAMTAELHLNSAQIGKSIGVFFWVYALAQVPAGRLADRWGGRRTLTLYVTVWSLAMIGLALATSYERLMWMRGLMGLGQAGAYATAAGYLKRWMPLESRGVANGSVSMGGRTGGWIAHWLTPQLMLLAGTVLAIDVGQWRWVFGLYGVLGFVWAIAFWRWFRDTPREHRGCNASEVALIEQGASGKGVVASEAKAERPQWRRLLASRNLWLLCTINFAENIGWIFLLAWLPTYLTDVHETSLVKAGWLTSLTGLAGMAGCLCGGAVTDRLLRRVGRVWARRLPAMAAMGFSAILYLACTVIEEVSLLIAMMAAIYFLHDMALGPLWSTYQDIGGVHVATVLGFTNMCGNLGAAISAERIGHFAHEHQWNTVFVISAACFGMSTVCWLFVDPRVTISTCDT